jgi:hypothetical protein
VIPDVIGYSAQFRQLSQATHWRRSHSQIRASMLTFHRRMNPSGGEIAKCVAPSGQAVFSFYTTCPMALHCTRSSASRRLEVCMIEFT